MSEDPSLSIAKETLSLLELTQSVIRVVDLLGIDSKEGRIAFDDLVEEIERRRAVGGQEAGGVS